MTTTYELYTNENGTPKAVEGKAPAILERVEALETSVETLETSVETLEETLDKGVVTSVNGNTGDVSPEQTGCLPLSGGTMTGAIKVGANEAVIEGIDDTKASRISGGTGWQNGGSVVVYGKDNANFAGFVRIKADDGTNETILNARPDGILTWGGKNVVRSVNGTTADASGNVVISIPNVYVTETWKNGTSWYRKWSDGLIEQYLSYTSTSEVVWSKDITVTLPTSMTTTNYKAVACLQGDQSRLELGLSAHSKTKTTVTFTGNSMSYGFDVYIAGY